MKTNNRVCTHEEREAKVETSERKKPLFLTWMGLGRSYLPEQASERLAVYVYRGTDKSFLYCYLWRPLCARLVTYLPVWLSANLITVTALVLVGATHVLVAFHLPNFSVDTIIDTHRAEGLPDVEHSPNSLPMFVFTSTALAMLSYVILDNLDGNQARRTRTASPLGLVVDHGCDALNCVISSLSVSAGASLGATWKTWVFMLSVVIPFVMNTWEEYYIGELVLPVINGANEGVVSGVLLFLFVSLIGGPQWWDVNYVTLPRSWLPDILVQLPFLMARAIDELVPRAVCPWVSYRSANDGNFSASSAPHMFFRLNCSAIHNSTLPLHIIAATNGAVDSHHVGQGVLQDVVLSFYDPENISDVQLQYNTIGVILFALCSVGTVLGNIIHVYHVTHQSSKKKEFWPQWLTCQLTFLGALTNLLPMLLLTLFGTLWLLLSPENIFQKHPRIFCWTFGLMYTKCAIHLMIAHVCNAGIHLPHRTFSLFLSLGAYLGFVHFRKTLQWIWDYRQNSTWEWMFFLDYETWSNAVTEEHALWLLLVISAISFVHLAVTAILEIAVALDVPVFTVPRSKQEFMLKQISEKKT